MNVNRYSSTPLYIQILDVVRERLEKGDYPVGEAVLSDAAIMEEFSVSRITAKRVIDELARIGLVTRERGRGTIVNPSRKTVDFLMFEGMAEAARKRDQTLSNRVLVHAAGQELPKEVFDEVITHSHPTTWYHLKRVRCIDGIPAMIDNIWIDEQAAPGISEFDFSKDSLKETLEEYYRMPLHYVQQILELERCEAEFSQLLEVPEGQQLLAATRAVYTSRSETPFMVALCHFRADLFRFHVEVDLSDRGSR